MSTAGDPDDEEHETLRAAASVVARFEDELAGTVPQEGAGGPASLEAIAVSEEDLALVTSAEKKAQ